MAHPIHNNWYQRRSILGDWSHNGGRGLPYFAPDSVLESKNSDCRDRSIHGVQQCQYTATEKISNHMDELVAQMDKTIRRYSLDLKEIFSQCDNNLVKISNKIFEDKKKSDDLWKTSFIKTNKNCGKADISENLDREYEGDAETTPNGQESVETTVIHEFSKYNKQHYEFVHIEEEVCGGIGDFSILQEKETVSAKIQESKKITLDGTRAVPDCGEYKFQQGVHRFAGKFVRRPKLGFQKKKKKKEGKARKMRRKKMQGRQRLGGCRVAWPLFSGLYVAESAMTECPWCSGTLWRSCRIVDVVEQVCCGSGGGPGLLCGGGVGTVWTRLAASN